MKKLTALLLAAMLLLTACGTKPEPTVQTTIPTTVPATQPETQPTTLPSTEPETVPSTAPVKSEKFDENACAPLFGTWKTTVTMDKELLNTSYFTKKVKFDLFYTFNEDGSFAIHVDEDAFKTAIADFEGLMVDHMVELRYFTFRGPLEYQGLTEEAILEQWGKGPEQEARQECEKTVAALNLYYRFKRLLREGQYYVNGSKVYTQLSADKFESNSFTVNGKIMSLNNTNNMPTYRDICVDFPLIFNKSE